MRRANSKRPRVKPATQNILYSRSGDMCAFPGCENHLTAKKTDQSDDVTVGEICHIRSISKCGPRGRQGLTDDQLNSVDNLILLCAHHHTLVDKQDNTYSATELMRWKEEHEAKVAERMCRSSVSATASYKKIIDDQSETTINRLKRGLSFRGTDGIDDALSLARRLKQDDYSDASARVRMNGLAWCARVLAAGGRLPDAERIIKAAEDIGSTPETKIARAVMLARRGDKSNALGRLADIDTPASKSAAFMVMEHHDGVQSAIDWLEDAGVSPEEMDPSGKLLLLGRQLEQDRWGDAFACLEAITDDDLREAPALHYFVGMTNLLKAVPENLRSTVFRHAPIGGKRVPLASTKDAVESLRTAHQHFMRAADAARQLDCLDAAADADEYSLWLGLRYPDLETDAQSRLKESLNGPPARLRFVAPAIDFGIELDVSAVEREIAQTVARYGRATDDTALARFAIMFAQRTPARILEYLVKYREEMADIIEVSLLQSIQIEMLSKVGRTSEAKELLGELSSSDSLPSDLDRLRSCIAESEGADPIDIRRQRFEQTKELGDLSLLVASLVEAKRWDDVCRYGKTLFEKTKSIEDAERLAFALHAATADERLSGFLSSNADLVGMSERLRLLRCAALYNDGEFVKARGELSALQDGPPGDLMYGAIYRGLRINLMIAMGDWNEVSAIVAAEYRKRADRGADELMALAEIACCLSAPNARELAFAAAERGSQDPSILMRGYRLAATHGWENYEDVGMWLSSAVSLSGEEGYVRKISLKEIMSLRESWGRHAVETSRLLSAGDIPMFFAAQMMNSSLGSLVLGESYRNSDERDPRRRSVIPAYSENRRPMVAAVNEAKTVAVDGAALLTLSRLELLDQFLDSWSVVVIPHSTLSWLLREKQLAIFHQRKIVEEAQMLQHLMAAGALEIMSPRAVPRSDLRDQVGDDLAQMLAEAEDSRRGDGPPSFVVRPAPVYNFSSLMKEEADLSDYSDVLVSCQSIVAMLKADGAITVKKQNSATDYLRLHEKPWTSEPNLIPGAVLYLDDLSITYFMHVGLLDTLVASGRRLIVARRSILEANNLVSHQSVLSKMSSAIERIRAALCDGIAAGKVKVGKRMGNQGSAKETAMSHPTIEAVGLAGNCDAIVVDDRSVNRIRHVASGSVPRGPNTPILSTLDVVDVLSRQGVVSTEDRLCYRDSLRRSGYVFVPVETEELIAHLRASVVQEGKVTESAELRIIRENVLSARMGNWLRGGDAIQWLRSFHDVLQGTLRKLWDSDDELCKIRARSDWLWALMDVRGWAHAFDRERSDAAVDGLYLIAVAGLTTLSITDRKKRRHEYHQWLEDRVLASIREQDGKLFSRIVGWNRQLIASVASAAEEERRGGQ